MKAIRNLTLFFFILLGTSCHVARFFYFNVADMRDYKKFPQRSLTKAENPFVFVENSLDNNLYKIKFPKMQENEQKIQNWDMLLEETKSFSLLIIKNDSILFERYYSGDDRIYPSFSVAKSYLSALIGIAIDEGIIQSVNEPITNYLDFFENEGFDKITIEHLLNMKSGIDFKESYFNPFGDIAKYYYGRNLKKYVRSLEIKEKPGQNYEYISVNTLLLGMIIEKASGKKLYEYLDEKLWKPLGMEFEATMNVDSEKHDMAKSYCCINARSRDFAKFGRLFLNKGNWNGKQIISEEWIKKSIEIEYTDDAYSKYHYQWRIRKNGSYYAQGILGQFIYVNPKQNIIIVRNGKKKGINYWPSIFDYIAKNI